MIDKFNQLQTIIAAEESNGRTAKIVDFELQSVSNQQTDLSIGVVYGLFPPDIEVCTWPDDTDIFFAHEILTPCLLNHVINYAWYQTITTVDSDGDIFACSDPQTSCQCIWEGTGSLDPLEMDQIFYATKDLVDCLILDLFGPPPPANSSNHGIPILLVDIILQGNAITSTSAIFSEKVVLGRGIPK